MSVRRLAPAEVQPESFAFSTADEAWLAAQVAKYPHGRQASAVIPALWRAQKVAGGWLPKAAIEMVAEKLDMPVIRVLEVATFYTMFNLAPVGRHFIQFCGTTPCVLRGADEIKRLLKERIGPEKTVTADGEFSWLEVECLGACCNAPMVQINDDYHEDLTPENFGELLDDLAAGRPVKKGSRVGRASSEPEGAVTTLTDATLYDGSRLGAWKERFEEAAKAAEGVGIGVAPAAANAMSPQAGTAPGAGTVPPGAATAITAAPAAGTGSGIGAGNAATATAPVGATPGAGAVTTITASAGTAAAFAAMPKETDFGRAAREVAAAREEVEIAEKLATLGKGATAEEKADAVGAKPRGLAAARGGGGDKLQRIKGIGPVNEGKLHGLGVFHFDQIAAWSAAETRWVGTYLAFPGRITREDWAGQAAHLAAGGKGEKD